MIADMDSNTNLPPDLPEWAPALIETVTAAVRGDSEMQQGLEALLPQMESHGWGNLVIAVRCALAGERDAATLFRDLDAQDVAIVRAILESVTQTSGVSGVRGANAWTPEVSSADSQDDDDHPDAISLDDFIALVGQACRSNAPAELGEQLYNATLGMSKQANGAPAMRELGRILNAILCGERQPDLAALPAPLAAKVQALLASLGS
jgi:hypothetical protein